MLMNISRMLRVILSCVYSLFLFHLSHAHGQDSRLSFDRLTMRDGLPQSTIRSIVQDQAGFMWFGTVEGLARFDGYECKVFRHDPEDPHSLSGNHITAMVGDDGRGGLWIGLQNEGLNHFNTSLRKFTRYRNIQGDARSLAGNNINALLLGREGTLWVGGKEGLSRFHEDTGTFTNYHFHIGDMNKMESIAVSSLVQDNEGQLWVGSQHGLLRFNPDSGKFHPQPLGDATPNITSLLIDGSGALWIGTNGLGLFHLFEGDLNHYGGDLDPKNLSRVVTSILEDKSGNLWVATEMDGLLFWAAEVRKNNPLEPKFENYRNERNEPWSLSSNVLLSLYEDNTHTIWIGTSGSGLSKWNPASEVFQHVKQQIEFGNGLSEPWVASILADRHGYIWVGHYGSGLTRVHKDRLFDVPEHFRHDPKKKTSLGSDWVLAMHEDSKGNLWVGSTQGISRYKGPGNLFEHFNSDMDEPIYINAILEDSSGNFWIGTRGKGLNLLPSGEPGTQFQHFGTNPKDPSNSRIGSALDLVEDREGNLWIAAYSGGLYRWHPSSPKTLDRFFNKDLDDSFIKEEIHEILEDSTGRLWIGSNLGLSLLVDPENGIFDRKGLSGSDSQLVNGIQEDAKGRLWVSTLQGLSRYNPETGSFTYFGWADGIQEQEFNICASSQTSDGMMIFGGVNGITTFYPEQVLAGQAPQPVILTDFLLFNQPAPLQHEDPNSPLKKTIHTTRSLTLTHKDRAFSFEFATPQYSTPQENRYAYRLTGFDRDWIYTDASRRTATYTNLGPGNYNFQVKSSDKNGIWNEQGASVDVIILPAPWQTWWARLFFGLFVLSIIVGIFIHLAHRSDLKQERAMNIRLRQLDKLKDAFLARTSHELRTPLQSMIGVTEAMMDDRHHELPHAVKTNLAILFASGRRLTGLVDNILDHAKLEHDDLQLQPKPINLHTLVDVVLHLTSFLFERDNLQLSNEVPKNLPPVLADEDRLHQILYNLIGNAVKFTATGMVVVSAELEDDHVVICVRDTGAGIEGKDLTRIFEPFEQTDVGELQWGAGLGLTVTRQLVVLHQGKMWVDAEPGKGSRFFFTLPAAIGQEALPIREQFLPMPAPTLKPVHAHSLNPTPGSSSFHILVVDDENINRRVLTNHLGTSGYRVSEAAGGHQAMELLEYGDVDLILLDVMMPDISGFDLCRTIRSQHAAHVLPIIFLSGGYQINDLVMGLNAGANDYLSKPIQRDELLARVRMHLDLLDITRRLDQKVEERTEEVTRLQELQNQFFSNITHELRTPLTLIIEPLEELLSSGPKLEDKLRARLNLVKRNGKRLATLINQLLDISKMDMGRMELEYVTADVASFLERCTHAFLPLAGTKNIELVFESYPPTLPFHYDPDKLEKVIYNLLSNAFKFTTQGSVSVRLWEEGSRIRITVQDTGKGIPLEEQERIFDRFYQLSSSSASGTGIGLSLVQDLVGLHNGEISVESEPGLGSTFTVIFPKVLLPIKNKKARAPEQSTQLMVPDPESVAQTVAMENHTGQATVLIIEDHTDLRTYIRESLTSYYQVLEAENGRDGLHKALHQQPDLIVSDIMMPEMDGVELCRLLKKEARTAHIPLILLTARTSQDSRLEGLEAGADEYLSKPFQVRELLARISNLLQTREAVAVRNKGEAGQEQTQLTAAESFLQQLNEVLDENLSNPSFGVYELAEELGVSRRQLLRKMKKHTGGNINGYIRNYRLERGADLLCRGSDNISEVAYAVGFKYPAHFTAQFHEKYGLAPRDFRQTEVQD